MIMFDSRSPFIQVVVGSVTWPSGRHTHKGVLVVVVVVSDWGACRETRLVVD